MPESLNSPSEPVSDDLAWVRDLLRGVFDIAEITVAPRKWGAIRIRGHFLIASEDAYARLAPQCRARGTTLLFREEKGTPTISIAKGVVRPSPNNRWLPIVLAVATVISVLFTYVILWEAPELTWASILGNLHKGLPFTLSLLGILLTHEFGHYFMARHLGVPVTPPYLIPFPLSPFGTMGAIIRMKDIPPNRRAMLLIGAAGPLAGLIVALPILIIGLSQSEVSPLPAGAGYLPGGNSLLYGLLKMAIFGRWLPGGGMDVMLHPLALAGWAGLLVTSLNLIPAGQLDGGHIAYALLGPRARYVTWAMVAALLVLGIWWQGWLLWAMLNFLFARTQRGPLDDVSPLAPRETALALAMLVLFVLIFTPLPMRIVQ